LLNKEATLRNKATLRKNNLHLEIIEKNMPIF